MNIYEWELIWMFFQVVKLQLDLDTRPSYYSLVKSWYKNEFAGSVGSSTVSKWSMKFLFDRDGNQLEGRIEHMWVKMIFFSSYWCWNSESLVIKWSKALWIWWLNRNSSPFDSFDSPCLSLWKKVFMKKEDTGWALTQSGLEKCNS